MVYQTIRLGYDLMEQKRAQKILFEKGRKQDFGLIRSYQVINLLNFIGKIVEKVVAKKLSHNCEEYFKLHLKKMEGQKERLAINGVATLVHTV